MSSDDDRGSVRAIDRRRRPLLQELLEWKRTVWWILAGLCGLAGGWLAVTRNWTEAVLLVLLAIGCAVVALVVQVFIRARSRRVADDG